MERTASKWIGSPWALGVLLAYSIVWFVVEGANIGWDGFATIFGLALVCIIQGSQNRDTAQIVTILDCLAKAIPGVSDEIARLDDMGERRIEKIKKAHLQD